ncbi:MAG: PAS domain-containing protein, partial [Spirochaetaceae bacterium]|nr:PAS domain-containing protein [Spirochaetaceae bacterium]
MREGDLDWIFRTYPAPVLVWDDRFVVRGCNDAFRALSFQGDREVEGKSVSSVCPEALSRAVEEGGREALERPDSRSERSFRIAEQGSERLYVLDCIAYPDAAGELRAMYGTIRDATPMVESERKIQRLMRVKDAILAINGSMLALQGSAELFDLVLEKVLAAVDHASVGCVLLLDGEGNLRIAAAKGYPSDSIGDFRVRLEDTF